MEELTTETILEMLPQGSGFNCDWEHIKTQKNGLEVFETYYANMSEYGFYDGYTRIRLRIDINNPGDFKMFLSGSSKYAYNREYFEDTIFYSLTKKELKQ